MIHLGTYTYHVGNISASAWNNYIDNFVNNLKRSFSGDRYATGRPIIKNKIQTKTVRKTTDEKVPPNIQEAFLVKLGGEFLEIGGEVEAVGGGNQKLG